MQAKEYNLIFLIISVLLSSCANKQEESKTDGLVSSKPIKEVKRVDSTNFEKANEREEYKSVTIGSQVWMEKNLNVSRFKNGDQILQAKTEEEWKTAGTEGTPVWCYYDNNKPKLPIGSS